MEDNEIKQETLESKETLLTPPTESVDKTGPKYPTKPYRKAEELKAEAASYSVTEAEMQLTEFQRKLVHNIVYKALDRATAAREAGSQAKSKEGLQNLAWETLRKPHVAAYMNYLIEKKNEIAGVDKVEVIEGLREILQLAKTDGKYKDALKALELLGSAIGLFKSVSQSTSIKKTGDGKSALLDDTDDDENTSTKKDLDKLINLVSNFQPTPKKK